MTEQIRPVDPTTPAGPDHPGPAYGVPDQSPVERVGRGLAFALLAIPIAVVLTVVIWRLGFIASIGAVALSALAAIFYAKGAGGTVRRGIPGLIAIMVIGAVVCFFAAVATDLVMYYRGQSAGEQAELGTIGQFVRSNLFYGPVLSTYGRDAILFGLFAVLGAFATIRRLIGRARS